MEENKTSVTEQPAQNETVLTIDDTMSSELGKTAIPVSGGAPQVGQIFKIVGSQYHPATSERRAYVMILTTSGQLAYRHFSGLIQPATATLQGLWNALNKLKDKEFKIESDTPVVRQSQDGKQFIQHNYKIVAVKA